MAVETRGAVGCAARTVVDRHGEEAVAELRVMVLQFGKALRQHRLAGGTGEARPFGLANAPDREGALLAVQRAVVVEIGFGALEVGQDVFEGPSRGAALRPLIVVRRVAADRHHAVDAGAAAHQAGLFVAARHEGPVAAQQLVVDPQVAPVPGAVEIGDAGIGIQHRCGHLPRRRVGAGLQQQHATGRIGREPVGEYRARGTAADDDVVEGHGVTGTGTRPPAGRRPPRQEWRMH